MRKTVLAVAASLSLLSNVVIAEEATTPATTTEHAEHTTEAAKVEGPKTEDNKQVAHKTEKKKTAKKSKAKKADHADHAAPAPEAAPAAPEAGK
jgi:hypothetical protein